MPIFDGRDPKRWTFHAKLYFSFYRLLKIEKLTTTCISLEGETFAWLKWNDIRELPSWKEQQQKILEWFSSNQTSLLYQKFIDPKHTRSIVEYQEKFEIMAAILSYLS